MTYSIAQLDKRCESIGPARCIRQTNIPNQKQDVYERR